MNSMKWCRRSHHAKDHGCGLEGMPVVEFDERELRPATNDDDSREGGRSFTGTGDIESYVLRQHRACTIGEAAVGFAMLGRLCHEGINLSHRLNPATHSAASTLPLQQV